MDVCPLCSLTWTRSLALSLAIGVKTGDLVSV